MPPSSARPVTDQAIEAAIAAVEQAPQPGAVSAAPGLPPASGSAQDERIAKDAAWLRAQAPTAYALQLIGAHSRKTIDDFVAEHQIRPPYAVFRRKRDGRPWYSLVAGVYENRRDAVAARAALEEPLQRGGVWPRSFRSIVKQIQN